MMIFLLVRQTLGNMKVTAICLHMMETGSLEVRTLAIFCPRLTTIGDLFDEADFSVAETGNPDEITLDQESQRQRQLPQPNNQNTQRGTVDNMPRPPPPNPAAVTPSKPERSWTAAAEPGPAAPNGPNHMAQEQRLPCPQGTPGPQNYPNTTVARPPLWRPSQDANSQAAGGQPSVNVGDGKTQGMPPPSSSPSVDGQRPPGLSPAAFFSARAVDMLRDHPQSDPSGAAQFDPHAESPSIRKTAGVDHTKSVPISKPMLAGVSPAANHTRDFINPSSDLSRKIGAPGGSGVGSPLNRGQSTSSYRPLTRPNVDPKAIGMAQATGPPPPNKDNLAPQNINGKRPPLSDVTNEASASGSSGPASSVGANDLKKPRFDEGATNPAQQQHQHQHQQPPQQR